MTQPSEATLPVEEVGVPLTFDDDEPVATDNTRSAEDIQREFEAGMIGTDESQPRPEYPEDYAVLVDAPELPTEPDDSPAVEMLLSRDDAMRLLDKLNGEWRRWGAPPFVHCFGKAMFSEHDLRAWVRSRFEPGFRRS